MEKQEILNQIGVLEKQNVEYNKITKDLEKQARKNLYWWFLFPLFGLIIFNYFVQKRKQTDQWQNDTILVKTELAKNEFQILKLKKELKKVQETQNV